MDCGDSVSAAGRIEKTLRFDEDPFFALDQYIPDGKMAVVVVVVVVVMVVVGVGDL